MTVEVDVVTAWHEALNAGDVQRLLSLVDDNVEVGGPRGSGRGADLLREWIDRAAIQLVPARVFHRDGTVVVEQHAFWRSPETGQLGEPSLVASVFNVHDGRIQSVMRFDNLTAALAAAGMDDWDEVEEGV